MRIIVAPECIDHIYDSSVFLAGGITNCPEWQDEIIELLKPFEFGVVFNPRRKKFPINNIFAAEEQIVWEYNALNKSDVFSMWFCNSDSDQPICMYELGKHLEHRFNNNDLSNVIIGIEPGYKRENDVRIQTKLVSEELSNRITNNIYDHSCNIITALSNASSKKLGEIFENK